MIWAIGLIVLLVALLIPLAVVALEAVRSRPSRRGGPGALVAQIARPDDRAGMLRRLAALEDEVDDLRRDLAQVRDDLQDVQRLLEDGESGERHGPSPSIGS